MSEPNLQITLFGSPSIMVDGHPVTGFPSSKVTALAYFLAATGRTHTRDALASLIWPDFDSASAKRNLRGALYHLRKHLGDFVSVNRQEAGFDLAQNVVVDCLRFEQAIAAASGLTQDSGGQIDLLREAAALYRGDFLDGFHIDDTDRFDDWQRAEQERYLHLIAQTLNALVQIAIRHNDTLGGVNIASRLVSLDPLREETHRHLMLLLAMDNQPGAALAQFDQCREILWDELGVEPDADTAELAARIEAGDFSGALFVPTLPRRRLHNLPAELTEFFDREEISRRLTDMLNDESTRLVTITGVGGIGKSRFVQHIGHELAATLNTEASNTQTKPMDLEPPATVQDGIFYVPLAGIEDSESAEVGIVAAIAEALQLDMTGNADMLDQLGRALADQRMTLILDNFEQLQKQANVLVQLLQQAPGITILVTSRTRLNVRGEQVLVLDGLPLPNDTEIENVRSVPAGQLFYAAAASATPGFEADREASRAIARTCRLLQGLPLGIELAASWTGLLTCEEIATEIQSNLDFLQSDMPDLPDRHRSLRAVFDQSWHLLTDGEKETLQKLAVFRGGFTREAAAQVAGADLRVLQSLSNKSLIRRGEQGTEDQVRFEIPEVLRQYADEHLKEGNERSETVQAHVRFYGFFLAAQAPELRNGEQGLALERIAVEIENLRLAHEWAVEQAKAGSADAFALLQASTRTLFDFYDMRGWFQEGATRFAAATEALDRLRLDGEIQPGHVVLQIAQDARHAWFLFHLGRHEASERQLTDCLLRLDDAKSKSMTDDSGAPNAEANDEIDEQIVFTLNYLGAVLRHRGKAGEAQQRLAQALEIATLIGDDYAASLALNTLGQVSFMLDEFDKAQSLCSRALTLKRQIGDRRGMIYSLTYLGRVAQVRGDLVSARAYFAETLDIAEQLDDPRGVALAQQNLGNVALDARQFTGARIQFQAALTTFRRIGSLVESSVVLTRLGEIAGDQQQTGLAIEYLQDALQTAIRVDSTYALTTALLGAAGLLITTERTHLAQALLAAIESAAQLDQRQRDRIVILQEQLVDTARPSGDEERSRLNTASTNVQLSAALIAAAEETIDNLDHLRRQL